MTNEERQQVIDALRFAEDVIDTDDYSLTLIYAALAIMRRERPRACLEADGFEPIYKD